MSLKFPIVVLERRIMNLRQEISRKRDYLERLRRRRSWYTMYVMSLQWEASRNRHLSETIRTGSAELKRELLEKSERYSREYEKAYQELNEIERLMRKIEEDLNIELAELERLTDELKRLYRMVGVRM
ncbi:MAG: hypothetical protein QXI58_04400 [Candidatus Micrarchaeia archaeon]